MMIRRAFRAGKDQPTGISPRVAISMMVQAPVRPPLAMPFGMRNDVQATT